MINILVENLNSDQISVFNNIITNQEWFRFCKVVCEPSNDEMITKLFYTDLIARSQESFKLILDNQQFIVSRLIDTITVVDIPKGSNIITSAVKWNFIKSKVDTENINFHELSLTDILSVQELHCMNKNSVELRHSLIRIRINGNKVYANDTFVGTLCVSSIYDAIEVSMKGGILYSDRLYDSTTHAFLNKNVATTGEIIISDKDRLDAILKRKQKLIEKLFDLNKEEYPLLLDLLTFCPPFIIQI